MRPSTVVNGAIPLLERRSYTGLVMAKKRSTIPDDVAAEVLFLSDHTCCKCRERGKAVQIHHIDEDPSNNAEVNLAVLCLQCHNETQVKGGFGRGLTAKLVTKYRDEWLNTVAKRKEDADSMALRKQMGTQSASDPIFLYPKSQMLQSDHTPVTSSQVSISRPDEPLPRPSEDPLTYISTLPEYKQQLLDEAHRGWDTGVTADMVQASYDYIDALEGILVALAAYYAPDQFREKGARKLFSEIIASRFEWHRTQLLPGGPKSYGTIVNVLCCGHVQSDVEDMVEDMVRSLVGYDENFDLAGWESRWRLGTRLNSDQS
jgi:hypothetical protein